jgi:hypothetical protein
MAKTSIVRPLIATCRRRRSKHGWWNTHRMLCSMARPHQPQGPNPLYRLGQSAHRPAAQVANADDKPRCASSSSLNSNRSGFCSLFCAKSSGIPCSIHRSTSYARVASTGARMSSGPKLVHDPCQVPLSTSGSRRKRSGKFQADPRFGGSLWRLQRFSRLLPVACPFNP